MSRWGRQMYWSYNLSRRRAGSGWERFIFLSNYYSIKMAEFFKNLFSRRMGLIDISSVTITNTINQDIINAIGSCYDLLCKDLSSARNELYYSRTDFITQQDLERELWIHFANRRLSEFEQNGRYYLVFNELLAQDDIPWNKILDLLEYVCKWLSINIEHYSYLEDILNGFESNINKEFDRLDYGYRVLNHCIVEVTSGFEIEAINEAITKSKGNVANHLQRAIQHLSSRPNPDVRNSIKESISAVEAICRELTGEDSLGKALKRLENKGIVIHKMLKEEFTKFYVYTNDSQSGIRHALMDKEGIYVPSKDEAYYMLVSCSAFVNYLRRKATVVYE
ncbi:MAG: hypothetical protein J6Z32_03620 [Bacteroidales bacterium]|nr:hypothetical protein [Bacteroidales bacterium]